MTRNMFGFPKRLYEETRRHFRVKEALPIKWAIGGLESGSGRVCDISSTGALIETSMKRPIGDGTVIALEQEIASDGGFLPTQGRVVWSKPRGFLRKTTLCGVEFVDASVEVTDRLKKRIQDRIGEMELSDKIVSGITIVLVLVMFGLGAYVISQRASIAQTVERSSILALNASDKQALIYKDLLSQYTILKTVYSELQLEYASTRILLAQTEGLLGEAKRQYAQAQEEISLLRSALAQAKVETLGENVKILTAQRDSLREDLKTLENEINTMATENPEAWQAQAGQYATRIDELDIRMKDIKYETLIARIGDHQKQIQATKDRIYELKQQAVSAKRETQRKRDELALAQGNRGFIVQGGKAAQAKDFSRADAELKSTSSPVKKVNINVSVF